MRGIILTLALLAAASPAAAQHQHGGQQQGGNAAGQHAGHGAMPEGWQMRLDRPGATAPVHFMSMEGHLHAQLGPSAIFYNPSTTGSGAYRAQGTFTQNRMSEHPEGYGILVGGRSLDAEGQDYAYFMVRQDGKFTVRHRAGSETHTLIDWTEHAAIRRPDAQGRAANALAVDVGAQTVRFLVNGTEVGTLPRQFNTNGVVGLRINHNVDVAIEGFGVQPAQ